MKAILIIAVLLLSVAIMGCTTNTQETSTPTDTEVNNTFNEFENTLLDETNEIDIGSII
ncbi:MAG TPA: hypothetical protein VI790_00775 [Candidatus Nanoarchaeia archaeon]|nr:hypothetical protein [Candidatus Nanoarchaeia archaeon]